MESAIYNEFKCHNQELSRLVWVRHLKKRDKEKMLKLLQKTNQSSAQTDIKQFCCRKDNAVPSK